ncbi:DUF4329 domain-containing protein [Roseomonas terrae]|jgi:hypothetical protein|uniref:DUF4329 domain-containing protein n=1 Tax=Neoroseomonas terrae TaxID=424799 RepID=A0ABS5EF43_9PROT|nr:DUF4329 domain-containing protein [Neoroseomonas terrae]MBR0649642.1 DUF4329 domain-containing protein [Neoroseomonas terrae]
MSDAPGQPKLTTVEGIRIEAAAYHMLSRAIGVSKTEGIEYGGVIYRNETTKQIHATGPIKGEPVTVDVGQHKINLGLGDNLKPLAWYHTHPLYELENIQFNNEPAKLEWDKFIGGDKEISDYRQIMGYVATRDGRFWRYDPPPEVQDSNYGPGSWGVVNFPRMRTGAKEVMPPSQTAW